MERELPGYWQRLQEHFYRSYREDLAGWGQFLGESAATPQIGIHGTSAGAIVLAISDSTQTQPARDVRAHLDRLLNPADEKGEDKVRQSPRFAMGFLGYLLLSKEDYPDKVKSLRENVYRRQIPGKALWGDYWAGEQDQA